MNVLTFAKNVCFNRLFYYINGEVFDVHNNVVTEVPNYAFLVVSAQEYLVDEKAFPSKGRELKKLTSLYAEHNAPFNSQKVVQQLTQQNETHSKFAFCYFKDSCINSIKKIAKEKVFLLPEELLITHLEQKFELSFASYELSPKVFGVQNSSRSQSSVLAKLQPKTSISTIASASEWLGFLFASLDYKKLSLLNQSIFNFHQSNKLKQVEPYINAFIFSILVYLATTSGYLVYQENTLEKHLDEQRKAQKALRQAEQSYEEKISTVNALKEPFNTPEYSGKIMAALGVVHSEAPFRLERLNFSKKTFRITGKAEDDVAVFKALNEHPDIYNVTYTTPTIKRGKFATFNISFTVEEKVL